MIVTGVALAAAAAVTHTAIDSTRKWACAVRGIPADGLVTVPALLDAVISVSAVVGSGHWRGFHGLRHPGLFVAATLVSSLLLIISRYMYQRAVATSPLSLTIPYLAFTPALLLATAYIFLGELPSPSGVVGVSVVALGGYLLNVRGGAATSAGHIPPGSTAAAVAALKAAADGPAPGGGNGGGGSFSVAPSALPPAMAAGLLLQRSASAATVAPPPDLENGGGGGGGGGGFGGSSGLSSGWLNGGLAGARGGKRAGKGGGGGGGSDGAAGARHALLWYQEPGSLLMLGVAVIWSITASLDKLGVLTGPSIWVYFAAQRAAIGAASLAYILVAAPRRLLLLRDQFPVMLAVSLLELAAVLLFLTAVRHLLVSYVVAIKRCNILFSVLLGAALFRESVGGRLPYVFLMLLGMTLIVLEPGAHSLVHSHNK